MCKKNYWGEETPVVKKEYYFKNTILVESYVMEKGYPKLSTKSQRVFKKGTLIKMIETTTATEYIFHGQIKNGTKCAFTITRN